jgi:hypothetical protein
MAFKDIFKDSNDINEKSVIGFLAFLVMIMFAISDIIAGYLKIDLIINDLIFNAFLIIVLGAFSISGIEKVLNRKTDKKSEETPPPTDEN